MRFSPLEDQCSCCVHTGSNETNFEGSQAAQVVPRCKDFAGVGGRWVPIGMPEFRLRIAGIEEKTAVQHEMIECAVVVNRKVFKKI